MFMCLSITFESLDAESLFLVSEYIFRRHRRPSSYMKSQGHRVKKSGQASVTEYRHSRMVWLRLEGSCLYVVNISTVASPYDTC